MNNPREEKIYGANFKLTESTLCKLCDAAIELEKTVEFQKYWLETETERKPIFSWSSWPYRTIKKPKKIPVDTGPEAGHNQMRLILWAVLGLRKTLDLNEQEVQEVMKIFLDPNFGAQEVQNAEPPAPDDTPPTIQ